MWLEAQPPLGSREGAFEDPKGPDCKQGDLRSMGWGGGGAAGAQWALGDSLLRLTFHCLENLIDTPSRPLKWKEAPKEPNMLPRPPLPGFLGRWGLSGIIPKSMPEKQKQHSCDPGNISQKCRQGRDLGPEVSRFLSPFFDWNWKPKVCHPPEPVWRRRAVRLQPCPQGHPAQPAPQRPPPTPPFFVQPQRYGLFLFLPIGAHALSPTRVPISCPFSQGPQP